MQATTLTVPAEYRDAFQLAAVYEVKSSGEWVADQANSMPRYLSNGHDEPDADLQGAYKSLGLDMDVLDTMLGAPEGPVEVESEIGTLAHVAESMADKIIPPRLAEAMECSPFTTDQAERVQQLTNSMAWAAGEAAAMHARIEAEFKARKAAAV